MDPTRVGVMGFSAGGELAGLVAFGGGEGDSTAADPVDRMNGRPDFAIFVYPGPLAVPASLPKTAPPAFLVAASDDPCCAVPTIPSDRSASGLGRRTVGVARRLLNRLFPEFAFEQLAFARHTPSVPRG